MVNVLPIPTEINRTTKLTQQYFWLSSKNIVNLNLSYFLQGVLRDEEDLELFDEQFKDAYRARKVDFFDDDDDGSY